MNYSLLLMADGTTNSLPLMIILGLFLIAMIFFTVIPQKRKQKQMLEMSSRIKVGDKIKTIGGIFGTIVGYDEENNIYTILSGNSTFEIDKGCVYSMEMLGVKTTEETKPEEEPAKVEKELQPVLEKEEPKEEVKH